MNELMKKKRKIKKGENNEWINEKTNKRTKKGEKNKKNYYRAVKEERYERINDIRLIY